VKVEFTEDGVRKVAQIAHDVNESTENIGARRLHTVMERLLEKISFSAPDESGAKITVNADFVDVNIGELVKDVDLSRYIL
jgi:ATP-dependent HslUV protease ATP-binding subunit HslU